MVCYSSVYACHSVCHLMFTYSINMTIDRQMVEQMNEWQGKWTGQTYIFISDFNSKKFIFLEIEASLRLNC